MTAELRIVHAPDVVAGDDAAVDLAQVEVLQLRDGFLGKLQLLQTASS